MSRLEQEIDASGGPVKNDGNEFSRSFRFTADFIGFQGHFPDRPILPGVVQLMAGSATAIQAAAQPLFVQAVSRAKFIRPVSHDDSLVVSGTLNDVGDTVRAAIKIVCGDEIAATFTLTLCKEQP